MRSRRHLRPTKVCSQQLTIASHFNTILNTFQPKRYNMFYKLFVPTNSGRISRGLYIAAFLVINILALFLYAEVENAMVLIAATLFFQYLVININCCRLRDSGFKKIVWYVLLTIVVFIVALLADMNEEYDVTGSGFRIYVAWYFICFIALILAPTEGKDPAPHSDTHSKE
ncbi:hypothetical protein SFA32_00860 [Buttiauxella sp. HR94]|nr:hypothetical protein SFA32_00860 [Buttiauxella sp. HR94]